MKAILSLEAHAEGFPQIIADVAKISYPNSQRIFHIYQAFRDGKSVEEIQSLTGITPYFLEQLKEICDFEIKLKKQTLTPGILLEAKRKGFSDALIGRLCSQTVEEISAFREREKIFPRFSQVDTCAGEFTSSTPYFYSSYWPSKSSLVEFKRPVVIIGSGPNRIGQGIEFDYGCVRGVKGYQRAGHQVIMINSNPETVSTDYDTSDILFFEPLTVEHVSEVLKFSNPLGFVAQLGGQTPINLAHALVAKGFDLMGSSLRTIDLAEDRGLFGEICQELKFRVPLSAMVGGLPEALKQVKNIGFPVICRPSYVLGGRRMEVIENEDELTSYFHRHQDFIGPQKLCLIDQFLEGALEVDVDLVRGKDWVVIGGVVEHIEAAGVHSGDSMGVLPPQRLLPDTCEKIEELSRRLADRIEVIGHLNLQLAVKDNEVFMLEANPRSSRSVPFVVKATQIPLIDLGVAATLGRSEKEVNSSFFRWRKTVDVSVKGVVFPFKKFSEADSILGPEMKSTGESMGRGSTYPEALMKAYLSSNIKFPKGGEVFFSLRQSDKSSMLEVAKKLTELGYSLSATKGTADFFNENGLETLSLRKVHEGRPHCVDRIRSGEVTLVVNTTSGRIAIEASFGIRRACTDHSIPCLTESDAAEAFIMALEKSREQSIQVSPLKPLEMGNL